MKHNKKHQALLNALLENFTTASVTFLTGDVSLKRYTYKVPASWDLKENDHLVVETPSGVGVVRVAEVHKTPQLDADADFQYKWAVQKVDRKSYDARVAGEQAFLEQLAVVERAHQRQELLSKVTGTLSGEALIEFEKAKALLNGTEQPAA